MELRVDKGKNNTVVKNNQISLNVDDFDTSYIKFLNTVYKIKRDPLLESNKIGLSLHQRKHHQLSFGDKIDVYPFITSDNIINDMKILVKFIKRPKNIITIHEDEFIDNLKKDLEKYYFYENQSLFMEFQNEYYNIIILKIGDKEGFINKKTNIEVISNEYNISIVTSNILSRDLFRDDYNFEELGIGGLDSKMMGIFRRALSSRAYKRDIIEKLGIKHVKGILLYGPPGTGKTLIGRKIGNLITTTEPKVVNGPELLNKYVGQGEENIRNLFADAKNDDNLHVIIFDEIDAICKKRGKSGTLSNVTDSMVNQFLSMIDGVHAIENIFIIGLTNRKDLLDDALLRPGRLEVHVEINLPDIDGREQIFNIHTSKMSDNNMIDPKIDLKKLAKETENFSGAEIESVVKNASSFALNELLSDNNRELNETEVMVQMYHFNKAIKEISPAFGNSINVLKELLPEKFLLPTQSHKFVFDKLNTFINKNKRLQSFLLYGLNGSGKTAMIIQAAKESKVTYTKLIRPIDLIGMDEYQKIQYITNIFKDSYISKESLIILDDIEILIDYARLGNNVTFSNKIYQTLLTVLKTTPINRDQKLTIILTCGEKELVNIFKPSVDYYDELKYLGKKNIEKTVKELDKENNIIDIPEIEFNNGISIKRLLLNLV